jgi:hypothetical protein
MAVKATLPTGSSVPSRGVVYTPPTLARFVVDCLCETGGQPEGRWLDPACGEGVFLVEAVRRLAAHTAPDRLPAEVEERLLGVDIDTNACARTRTAVKEEVARYAGPQDEAFFAANVLARDFLALSVADVGSFGAVLGNPPYVSATHLAPREKQELLARFETAWGRLDLYALFFERAVELLAPAGRLAFITPDKFLTAESARPLRAYLVRHAPPRLVARFQRHDLFPGVATVPAVTVLEAVSPMSGKASAPATTTWWDLTRGGDAVRRTAPVPLVATADGQPWRAAATRPSPRRSTVPLGALVTRVSAGLATGLNACYVLPTSDAEALGLEPALLRRAVRGRDISAGNVAESGLRLLVPYNFDPGDPPRLVELERHPGAAAHLARHRDALERRHCVRVWRKRWYDLHDPVVSDLAVRPKLLVPDLARTSRFAFDPGRVVPLHSAYYLEIGAGTGFEPEALAALLNTPELEAELLRRAPLAKSGYRRFRAQFLRELPVPKLTPAEQAELLGPVPEAAREPIAWKLSRDAA